MVSRSRNAAPLAAFALCLATVYGLSLTLLSRLERLDDATAVAVGITLDLTVGVPVLYYLLMVRWRGWPALSVLPVFALSVVAAEALIPETRQQALAWITPLAIAVELALLGWIVTRSIGLIRTYRARAESGVDVDAALREAAVASVGPTAGNALAYELAVLYYAVRGWRSAPPGGGEALSYHERSSYIPLAAGLMMAVVVETLALHLLVQLWSPAVAWVLTVLSLYALVWLIGDTHAVRLRPMRLRPDRLQVRVGLRWTLDIPREAIVSIEEVREPLSRKTAGYLDTTLFGQAQRRLTLRSPVEALGPYGLKRQVDRIDLQLDDPERLDGWLESE